MDIWKTFFHHFQGHSIRQCSHSLQNLEWSYVSLSQFPFYLSKLITPFIGAILTNTLSHIVNSKSHRLLKITLGDTGLSSPCRELYQPPLLFDWKFFALNQLTLQIHFYELETYICAHTVNHKDPFLQENDNCYCKQTPPVAVSNPTSPLNLSKRFVIGPLKYVSHVSNVCMFLGGKQYIRIVSFTRPHAYISKRWSNLWIFVWHSVN